MDNMLIISAPVGSVENVEKNQKINVQNQVLVCGEVFYSLYCLSVYLLIDSGFHFQEGIFSEIFRLE